MVSVSIKPLSVKIPENIKVALVDGSIKVEGPKGTRMQQLSDGITIHIGVGEIIIEQTRNDKKAKALYGLTRALLANAIFGVSNGFAKTLELSGVGYRAIVSGDELNLSVGFSHPVKFKAPAGITFTVSENKITIAGIDKQLVGQIAHTIRAVRPPEPYKGKGIRYEGEKIRRKAGKAAAKTVGAK